MQKLSSELVKRILGAGLTQAELANLLQIGRIQDDSGRVRGLSYKYTCEILKKCNQTFYNAKEGLEKKGFIQTKKDNRLDIDVYILNNNFYDKDFSKGYIDLQMKLFDDEDFYKLSANEMALALDLFLSDEDWIASCNTNSLIIGRWSDLRTDSHIQYDLHVK